MKETETIEETEDLTENRITDNGEDKQPSPDDPRVRLAAYVVDIEAASLKHSCRIVAELSVKPVGADGSLPDEALIRAQWRAVPQQIQ